MEISGVTVGREVSDLERSARWYEQVLERGGPDLRPVDDVIEYHLDGFWLQLGAGVVHPDNTTIRFGVPDVRAERLRIEGLGVKVEELIDVPGVVSYFEFTDPDRYRLSCYTVASD